MSDHTMLLQPQFRNETWTFLLDRCAVEWFYDTRPGPVVPPGLRGRERVIGLR